MDDPRTAMRERRFEAGDAAAAGGGVEAWSAMADSMATADEVRTVLERKAAALKERSAPKLLELLEAEFVSCDGIRPPAPP